MQLASYFLQNCQHLSCLREAVAADSHFVCFCRYAQNTTHFLGSFGVIKGISSILYSNNECVCCICTKRVRCVEHTSYLAAGVMSSNNLCSSPF